MSRWRERWHLVAPYAVPAAVYLVVLLAVFYRLWTPIDDARRAFGWDAVWEYWGDLEFQVDAYADGELPLWNPYDRAGYPVHADPQAGVLYPPTWGLIAFAALLGSTPWWLIAVKIIGHFWLACLGLHLLARRHGAPPAACYVGGAIFVLSYAVTQNLFSALNWNLAWAPWAMLAVEHWAERPRWGRGAVVALVLAMCALAGAPGALWYALLVVVPYGTWAVVHHARLAPQRADYLRTAGLTAAAAGALFAAMVLAQFSGTAALVGESVRASRDMDFIAFSTFGADDIAGFVIPRNVGGNTYLGYATVLWIGILVTAFVDARRLVLAGVAVFGVLLALGSQGDFLPFAASSFSPFGFFRRAHRYLYVTQLAVAVLGAEGLAALLRLERDELRRRVRGAVVVVGLIGLTVFATGYVVKATATGKDQPLRDAFALAAVAVVVTTWVTYMILRCDGRWRRVFGVVAVVALTSDLWFAQSPRIAKMMHAVPKTPRDGEIATLDGVPGDVRIYDRDYLKYRPGIRLGIRDLGGYEGDPLALARYGKVLERVTAAPRLLGHANVRYLLEAGRLKTKKSAADREALRSIRPGVFELAKVAPAVFWVDRAVSVESHTQAWAAIAAAPPGTVAAVETALWPDDLRARATSDGGELAPVSGRVIERQRNRLVVEIDAPAAGVVVVAESFYPGWQARVDGEPAPIAPANALFRAVFVEAGRHRIELEYRAAGWRWLAMLSLAAMLLACAIVVWDWRRLPVTGANG